MAGSAVLLSASPAFASFHFMKIEQAMGGVSGDTFEQVVQLRMRAAGQNFLGGTARLVAWDGAGLNPVVLISFPSHVANGAQGARVLIVSGAFAAMHPDITADFTMTNVIPPSYLAAGRLTFEDSGGTIIYWSLAWGGASYTGPTTGDFTNDPDGNFGPPFPGALPSTTTQALRFSTPDPNGSALSTTNAADYSVTAGAATVTNNAGNSFPVTGLTADLSITKTDGHTTASPSQSITYTIVATNAGPSSVTGATVVDTPPASLMGVTWTCVGAGGGTCAPSGAGPINDTVDLPVSATVTYTMTGTVSPAPSSLRNTATVNEPGGVDDPNPDNNSATDSDVVVCGETVVLPDGRLTTRTFSVVANFGASLKIGNSYSVEFKRTTGDATPPGTVTMYAGDDGCSNVSTLTVRDTSDFDPGSGAAGVRVSFTAEGTETFFRARLVGGPSEFTLSWSDTTMLSPAWTTNGAFDTFYSFQNTTGFTLNGTLTLFDTAGTVVSTANLVMAAGETASTNTSALGTDRNRAGTARFTHDGPPGAIVAEAAVANFSISPAYVQPIKFQAVRESR